MPPPATITVSADRLSRRYGSRTAVRDVSFELRQGEVLGFLGPNGAGKTTTMQMLTGNLAPSGGSVRICGIDLLERPLAAKALLGYLPETPPLYRDLTVAEYLELAAKLHRVAKPQLKAAVAEAQRRCGLQDVGRQLIGSLSKGYQQRVGIAQAIVHNPQVIILDEPTAGLDPIQIGEIRALIRELGGEHSVILSTHILPEVESVCDRVQIMHRGELVYSDGIDELKRRRAGNSLLAGLHRPPETEELARIAGVARVERLSATEFRIHHHAEANPAEAFTQAAAQHGWGLYQLTPEHTSLEDVFVQLTQQDET